jgi:putative hydrolase of the HAD superfamily
MDEERAARMVLLLDLDGVLRRWPPHEAEIERRYGLAPGAIHAVAFSPALLADVISGRIDDSTWRTEVRSRLSEQYDEHAAGNAVADWSRSCGEVDHGVLEVLEDYDLDVVLATNATDRLVSDLRQLHLHDRFVHVVNSSEVGVAKPDPAFFVAALAAASVEPDHALFVDDSPENVHAASRMGMRSHLYTGHAALAGFLAREAPGRR